MMRPTVVTRGSSFCAHTGAGANLGIDAHGTEFVDGEQRAIEADARLAVEHAVPGRRGGRPAR